MRNLFFSLAVLLISPLLADQCEEQIYFSFDGRNWIHGFEDSDGISSIVEFVPEGQTVDDWNEMVSVQRLPPIKEIQNYYKIFIEKLNGAVAPFKAHSKIIQLNDNMILFDWWVDVQSPDAQHEWFKLMRTPHSTLVIRYTTKKLNEVDNVGPTWEDILQKAHFDLVGDCGT